MMIYILFFFLQFLPSCVSQPQNKQQTKHCCMLGIKAVKRVNPRSTHHKKILFFYCFIYIKIYLYLVGCEEGPQLESACSYP